MIMMIIPKGWIDPVTGAVFAGYEPEGIERWINPEPDTSGTVIAGAGSPAGSPAVPAASPSPDGPCPSPAVKHERTP